MELNTDMPDSDKASLPGRILIANRGEIACRIIKTCRKMGIDTIALYSEADRIAQHKKMADASVFIGPSPASESYLSVDAILSAAKESGADAVHPGYGFLSENPGFARAVQKAGLTWIGPAADVIETMGDKERARRIASEANIPVLPGSERFTSSKNTDLEQIASSIGFPLLVKAAAGGGGIGMQVVFEIEKLSGQILKTQELAERLFNDSSVYLEHYVPNARHIEVQVFGFGDGRGIHLFDRDCTIQRRFQKIIEEAPAPGLRDSTRKDIRDAALSLVRSQKYLGAGTVEFIYDCDNEKFFFLEMNTRIQVEHTVTEMVTGIDLVEWQIDAANGNFDSIESSGLECNGHSVECRIYAERPYKNFLPSPGTLTRLSFPEESDTIRVDTGVREGDTITPYYDPMIAKLVTHGTDRVSAINAMSDSLSRTAIEGVETNVQFLQSVMADPDFADGTMTTNYVRHRFNSK